jgi:hypothetical protein
MAVGIVYRARDKRLSACSDQAPPPELSFRRRALALSPRSGNGRAAIIPTSSRSIRSMKSKPGVFVMA